MVSLWNLSNAWHPSDRSGTGLDTLAVEAVGLHNSYEAVDHRTTGGQRKHHQHENNMVRRICWSMDLVIKSISKLIYMSEICQCICLFKQKSSKSICNLYMAEKA